MMASHIPQFAITDMDSSRPQTPVSDCSSSVASPISPTTSRIDSLSVDGFSGAWRRRRASSVSTLDTLPSYSGRASHSPTPDLKHKRRNSASPSIYSEAPSYRTIPEDHDSTEYHLYRIAGPGHLTVHEVPDRMLALYPKRTAADGTPLPAPGFWRKTFTHVNHTSGRCPDSPKSDPRLPKYFVHKPWIKTMKSVPYTLRAGPNKNSPIACRFDGGLFWRKWVFNFEDINGEGVVDERGVIAEHFPQKRRRVRSAAKLNADGKSQANTSTSPPLVGLLNAFKKRREERKQNKTPNAETLEASLSIESADNDEPKIVAPVPLRPVPIISVAGEPISDVQREALAPVPDGAEPSPSPARTVTPSTRPTPSLTIDTSARSPSPQVESTADDVVVMKWENKLSRQYSFVFRGITFYWKGTSSQKDTSNKKTGALNRFNHLKLVADLPDDDENDMPRTPRSPCLSPDDCEKPRFHVRRRSSVSSFSSIFSKKSDKSSATATEGTRKQILVATYTCVHGKRKAGRLVIDNSAIEKLVQIIVAKSPTSFSPVPRRRSSSISSVNWSPASPPSKKKHAHVFPTPREQAYPSELDLFIRERLRHLTVATCVAMANSEAEKRHFASEAAFLAAEIAQNVACG